MSNEYLIEIERELSEKASELSSWRSLIEFSSWKRFYEEIYQLAVQETILLGRTPLSSMDKMALQEFAKGEAAGKLATIDYPTLRINVLEAEIAVLEAKRQQEKDNVTERQDGTTAASGGGSNLHGVTSVDEPGAYGE